jgi:hypothetical protein
MLQSSVSDTVTSFIHALGCYPEVEPEPYYVLNVRAEVVGWALLGAGEPTYFASGRCAENAAKSLARALARHGQAVELRICDRSGATAGRYVFGTPNSQWDSVSPSGAPRQGPRATSRRELFSYA